jgi:dTDP-4-dehydrorhamnose 3,5-epimerase-like enzyme
MSIACCFPSDIRTAISEVLIIEPRCSATFFCESFRADGHAALGIAGPFIEDNLSRGRGVLRGLHLQNPKSQGKLVIVLRGGVRDVAVDVRIGSPTFGRHVAVDLSEENRPLVLGAMRRAQHPGRPGRLSAAPLNLRALSQALAPGRRGQGI